MSHGAGWTASFWKSERSPRLAKHMVAKIVKTTSQPNFPRRAIARLALKSEESATEEKRTANISPALRTPKVCAFTVTNIALFPPRQKKEEQIAAAKILFEKVVKGRISMVTHCMTVVILLALLYPILSILLPQTIRPTPAEMAPRPPTSDRKASSATRGSLIPKCLYRPWTAWPGANVMKPTSHKSAKRFEKTASLNSELGFSGRP
mmetsp:Transcript_43646/g.98682  ORF Transcript_43646/g.98682 Transcript_43646/m.98682 type:complete len:207 (-) Transcript_43646:345-965(-)